MNKVLVAVFLGFGVPAAALAQSAVGDIVSGLQEETPADCVRLRDGQCAAPGSTTKQLFPKGSAGARSQRLLIPAKPRNLGTLPVNFLVGSAELTRGAKAMLDDLARGLARTGKATAAFFVDGHTDSSGSCIANLNLSRERANSAVEYLAAKGVKRDLMMPRGFGYSQPKLGTLPSDPRNRRVEVVRRNGADGGEPPRC